MMTIGVATPKTHAKNNIAVVIAMPATSPARRPAKIAFVLLIAIVELTTESKCWNKNQTFDANAPYNFSNATRSNVATMRVPATNVPRHVPETFDSPPVRRRWFTGTSRMRSPERAAFICISRFQP